MSKQQPTPYVHPLDGDQVNLSTIQMSSFRSEVKLSQPQDLALIIKPRKKSAMLEKLELKVK